ncbi:MAG: type II toxin-antitoxin system RelE/ParE family toxin [Sedimenticola sp.]
MIYEIKIKRSAQKSLAKIPLNCQDNIIGSIRRLSNEPRPEGCKKLSGRDAWRIRIGQYRVLYEIHNTELQIMVVKIGHRGEVYKQKS